MPTAKADRNGSVTENMTSITVEAEQWHKVFVFPDAIASEVDGCDHGKKAEDTLRKQSQSNLLYLAGLLGMPANTESRPEVIAESLLTSSAGPDLVRLVNFAKKKSILSAVEEQYDHILDVTSRKKAQGDFEKTRVGKTAKLSSFAKLCTIVANDSKHIERLYVYALWRSRATQTEYIAESDIRGDVCDGVLASEVMLAEDFAISPDYSARLFLHVRTNGGLELFLFQREKQPRVQADYRSLKAVTHGFGWVLFGIQVARNRIVVKGGGEEAAEIVKGWVEDYANVKLNKVGLQPFSDYSFEDVANRLLGDYSTAGGVALKQLKLTRCNRRTLSPITIGPPEYGESISADLKFLKANDAVAIHSLTDLASLRVRYDDHDYRIVVDPDPFGAILLRVDDSGCSPEKAGEFFDAFESAFGLPLNCKIDPRSTALGHAPVIAWLLTVTSPEQVTKFNRDTFATLLEKKVLSSAPVSERICGNKNCRVRTLSMAEGSECPECHQPIVTATRNAINCDEDNIYDYLLEFFSVNTRRTLRRGVGQESKRGKVYHLQTEGNDSIQYDVLVSREADAGLINRCAKSHRPVLVVHTQDYKSAPVADGLGVVHAYLADIIAVSDDALARAAYCKQLEELLDEGQLRQNEIALRAAGNACANIVEIADGYTDQDYERDVFSILRCLFPAADRWGGPNKPDGFVSVPYLAAGELRSASQLNFSYDAKLTFNKVKGYDLNRGEKRKAFDYVLALKQDALLQTDGNKLDAHVFVSNKITDTSAAGVAKFFREKHLENALNGTIPIVVMLNDFLIAMHRETQRNSVELGKRAALFGRYFADLFLKHMPEDYRVLSESDAMSLIKRALDGPAVDKPVDAAKLKASIATNR